MRLDESDVTYTVFQVFWLIGLSTSALCFLIQIIFFLLIRKSRKTDEKILAQITFTRNLVTVCEYYMYYIQKTRLSNDIMFTIYFVSDFALVCLMLVFAKNLYDNIVTVFSSRKIRLICISIIVWVISLVFGFICIFILKYHINYFELYCKLIYASIKFLIVTINLLIYFRIFYVAFKRGSESTRNVKDVIKTAFVAFLLVTTTCLQVVITDLISYFRNIPTVLVKTFCVINSFHAVFITLIFVIILKSKISDSVLKTVRLRLSELRT